MAWLNLGVALRKSDQDPSTIILYQRALAIAPNWALAAINLGNALAASGETDGADRLVIVEKHIARH